MKPVERMIARPLSEDESISAIESLNDSDVYAVVDAEGSVVCVTTSHSGGRVAEAIAELVNAGLEQGDELAVLVQA